MQDIDVLFVANPFAARSFLTPLLAFGAFASTALTVLDAYALFSDWSTSLCSTYLWVGVQLAMQIVQSPIRAYLLYGLYNITGSLNEAAATLQRITHSPCWKVNKQLGAVHAAWSGIGIGMLYFLPSDTECIAGRRLLQVHVMTFTLRCVMTIVWFASTFAMELPQASHQAETGLADAKKLVDELPIVTYRTDDDAQRFRMTTCVVCLCEHEDGEELRELGCGHYWHTECLTRWLAHRRTCPLCQRWDARPPSMQRHAMPANGAQGGDGVADDAAQADVVDFGERRGLWRRRWL